MSQDNVMSCVGIACRLGVPRCTTVVYCTLRIMCVHDVFKTSEGGLKISTMTYRYLLRMTRNSVRDQMTIYCDIIFLFRYLSKNRQRSSAGCRRENIHKLCETLKTKYMYNLKDL